MRRLLYTLLLAVISCAAAQYFEPPPINPDPVWATENGRTAAPASAAQGAFSPADNVTPVPREYTRVAVLGYHNFSKTKPVTEMLMRTSEFRRQMEYIRDAGLRVISMQEFLDWRLGNLQLPARCVLITLDDGWKSVYTDAYPILKEFGYPFTLFLYTKYLTGKGDSMTPAMIREMQRNGATIGSHSTSHYYPKTWKEAEASGEAALNTMLDIEIGESLKRLSSLFGPINTYCYPGGYVTQPMVDRLAGYGYVAAFTVVPGKVTITEDVMQVHRYMVFGTDASIFDHAMNFDSADSSKRTQTKGSQKISPTPPFPVFPLPNSTSSADIPVISAQLSGLNNVDLSSVRMHVSGFGRVPAEVDAATSTIRWVPPFRVYLPTLTVRLMWKTYDGSAHKAEWFFHVDQKVPLQP